MTLCNDINMQSIGFGPGPVMPTRRSAMFYPVKSEQLFRRAWNRFVAPSIDRSSRKSGEENYVAAVANGIKAGYRLIDFSTAYGDARLIAEAIKRAGVPRKDLQLTARICNRAQRQGPESVRNEISQYFEQYETEYVDILMFHWPVTDFFESTWRVLCDAYEKGQARCIGVANCHRHHLERLMNVGLKPMINQFEVHPLFTQKDLVRYNQDNGIVVEAYTPIARFDDRLMRLPKLKAIAASHGKTLAQVVLRWHVQQGLIPVVRSLNPGRQRENLAIFDFELSEAEMKTIDGFNINSRLRYDPDNCDFSIL